MQKHHIIPKHQGGANGPTIEVTVKEHALIHYNLWQIEGRWQDKVAWLALTGQIGREEAQRVASHHANSGRPPWNKGLTKDDARIAASAAKISQTHKKDPRTLERCRKAGIASGPARVGKKRPGHALRIKQLWADGRYNNRGKV